MKLVPLIFVLISSLAYGQYDTVHYMPPVFVSDAIKTSSANCRDHFLLLSTLEPTTFQVTILRGDGTPFSDYTIQTGSQASTGVFNLSRTTPIKLKFNNTGFNVENIISRGSLNTVLDTICYTMSASKPFFANIRHLAGSQGGSLTCKGTTALGTNFFAGFQAIPAGSSSIDRNHCHFIAIMATLNNTNVTIDGFNSGVTFYGQPNSGVPSTAQTISVTLNAGESYVIAQTRDSAAVDMNEYNGTRITSDKNIVINTGSWTGPASGNSRDIGIDQMVPASYAGEKYAIVKGNNTSSNNGLEKIIIISTQTGTTNVTFGAGPAVVLNGQGDYAEISGNSYWTAAPSVATGTNGHRNIAMTSDQPIQVFQTLFGSTSNATSSMNLIPPLADCIGSDSIYIPDVEQFGNNTTITITSPTSSTIKIEDEAGATLLTISPSSENLPGTIITDFRTSVYSVPNTVTDVLVTGDEKFTLGYLGASSVIGGAGYVSAFSDRAVEYSDSDPLFIGNGRARLDLCEENPSYITIADAASYDDFQWIKDNTPIPGETDDSLAISTVGEYKAIATYCSLPLESTSVIVDEFGSPGEQGFSKIIAVYESETFDGFSEGSEVVDWDEQSKNFNTASRVTKGPEIRTSNVQIPGYHPIPKFSATDSEYLKTINLLNSLDGSNHFTFFIVLKDSNTVDGRAVFSFENSANGAKIVKTASGYAFSQSILASGGPIIANVDIDQSEYVVLSGVHTGTALQLFANGKAGPLNFGNMTTNTIDANSESIIGGGEEGSGHFFDGYIAEFSLFDTTLLPAERQIVETYYGVKYGITFDVTNDETGINDGDYVSNNGSVIWDYSANTPYHNSIGAIGLDECGRLRQWQNKSSLNDDVVAIGIGSIEPTVGSNPNSFTVDNTYFVWGRNTGAFDSQGVTDFGATVNSEIVESRVARVWKSQEIGSVGSLRVQFDLGVGAGITYDLNDTRLLVDQDGTFASGATSIAPTSFNNSTGIVNFDHDFNSTTGFFFSLGTIDILTTPLPIELGHFSVKEIHDGMVSCQWSSLSENDNDYYTLERSSDGKKWHYYSTVKGAGNSTVKKNYKFVDKTPFEGLSYYRLSQTDFNGDRKYLGVESVFIKRSNPTSYNIYPNPAKSHINIISSEGDLSSIIIANRLGQKVGTYTANTPYKTVIDISTLPKGVYFVKIANKGGAVTKKVIVE